MISLKAFKILRQDEFRKIENTNYGTHTKKPEARNTYTSMPLREVEKKLE